MAPGIGIGIGIGRGGGGSPWPSYWTTLISATVETAAPTHVVLTFPDPAALVAADLTATVNGVARAVSSASWTGSVWTAVLASAVEYGDVVVVTFVPSGGTAAVTNNITHPLVIEDGNTVAWYDSSDLTTITKDGSDLVSRWNDKLLSGHDLIQATGTNQPLWVVNDGVLFDGVDNWMRTADFAYNVPEKVYLVFRQITWTPSDRIIDGSSNQRMALQQYSSTPIIIAFTSGGDAVANNNAALNTFVIVRALFANPGKFQINNTAAVTGNFGTTNAGAITLGASGIGTANGHCQFKEAIFRDIADSAGDEVAIYNYLATKYGFATI